MTQADRVFERFPDFIREYIYSHSWESLRAVQVAAANTIFDTDKKLQSFCVKWNNGAFNEKASDYSSLLNQKLREYNEEFFQNKALIIFSNCKWNWAREPQVKKVSVKNTVLVLEINLKRGAYSDIAESCTFFIEIDKADCKDITNILVEETTRIK